MHGFHHRTALIHHFAHLPIIPIMPLILISSLFSPFMISAIMP
jgi:hypothetical protein